MKRFSRPAMALSVVMLLSSAALAQQASPACHKAPAAPVDLGTLGGSFSQANAVNILGGIAGASTTPNDSATHAFVTSKAGKSLVDIGTLAGGTNSSAAALNAFGAVVGTSDYLDPVLGIVQHPFIYQDGKISDLGTLGGAIASANGIDLEGIVVGSSLLGDQATTHAFWYDPFSQQINDLGALPNGTNSAAYAVNLKGKVAGSSETGLFDANGSAIVDAVVWDIVAKSVTDLGNLGGSSAQASAINFEGVVVGLSSLADGSIHAFVTNKGKLQDIGTLGGSFAQATGINDLGVVVGYSNTTGDANVHAFLWTAKKGLVDLNSLLPANSGWELTAAYGINLEGEIVGIGTHNGAAHGFALRTHSERDDD